MPRVPSGHCGVAALRAHEPRAPDQQRAAKHDAVDGEHRKTMPAHPLRNHSTTPSATMNDTTMPMTSTIQRSRVHDHVRRGMPAAPAALLG